MFLAVAVAAAAVVVVLPPSGVIRLPTCHTFSHRLIDGTVVHGHVRRYHPLAGGETCRRRDVGRRCPRALVILTRHPAGGSRTYGALLRCMEALVVKGGRGRGGGGEDKSCTTNKEEDDDGMRYLLHSAYREHLPDRFRGNIGSNELNDIERD